MQDQIADLTLNLQSAHLEIDELTLENKNLKTLNESLTKQNELFKKLTYIPTKLKSSITKKNKNKQQTFHDV